MKFKRIPKEEWEYIYHKVPRAGVDIVVKTPKGVLLAKRTIPPFQGKWNLPGVGILFRELIKHAITRIAKDELDIKVKVRKYLGTIEYLNDGDRHTISSVYLVTVSSGKIKNSDQSEDIKIFKVVPNNTNPYQKRFLSEHLDQILSQYSSPLLEKQFNP